MIFILFISLLAGALSVLAPCVLPFLPVIVGGSVAGNTGDSKGKKLERVQAARPYIIAAGLVVSLLLFTLLLKASTALIGIDPVVWQIISGIIVILLGLTMLFPDAWARISAKLRLGDKSHKILHKAQGETGATASPTGEIIRAILTGAALGPVFSSCSPTYAWVIATVLPSDAKSGILYLSAYCVGVAIALLAISLVGRKLIQKLNWAADPKGWFQRVIAIVFIIVGVFVATGLDKQVQAWILENIPGVSFLDGNLIPQDTPVSQG